TNQRPAVYLLLRYHHEGPRRGIEQNVQVAQMIGHNRARSWKLSLNNPRDSQGPHQALTAAMNPLRPVPCCARRTKQAIHKQRQKQRNNFEQSPDRANYTHSVALEESRCDPRMQRLQIKQRKEVNRLELAVDRWFAADLSADREIGPQQLRCALLRMFYSRCG